MSLFIKTTLDDFKVTLDRENARPGAALVDKALEQLRVVCSIETHPLYRLNKFVGLNVLDINRDRIKMFFGWQTIEEAFTLEKAMVAEPGDVLVIKVSRESYILVLATAKFDLEAVDEAIKVGNHTGGNITVEYFNELCATLDDVRRGDLSPCFQVYAITKEEKSSAIDEAVGIFHKYSARIIS